MYWICWELVVFWCQKEIGMHVMMMLARGVKFEHVKEFKPYYFLFLITLKKKAGCLRWKIMSRQIPALCRVFIARSWKAENNLFASCHHKLWRAQVPHGLISTWHLLMDLARMWTRQDKLNGRKCSILKFRHDSRFSGMMLRKSSLTCIIYPSWLLNKSELFLTRCWWVMSYLSC